MLLAACSVGAGGELDVLHLAFRAMDVGLRNEVILARNTFVGQRLQ
ncbi:hypothetical protein ACFQPG_10275 [Sphingomonas sp. GCM10030256]